MLYGMMSYFAKSTGEELSRYLNKYVRLRGLTYIHTCRSYIRTPRELDRHVSHKSLEASHYNKGALANSSDFGLLGEQSSQKMGDSLPWTPTNRMQNLTPLALSSAEKSVTVQTNRQTNKQTSMPVFGDGCICIHRDRKWKDSADVTPYNENVGQVWRHVNP